jgi:hypothetical protein
MIVVGAEDRFEDIAKKGNSSLRKMLRNPVGISLGPGALPNLRRLMVS